MEKLNETHLNSNSFIERLRIVELIEKYFHNYPTHW